MQHARSVLVFLLVASGCSDPGAGAVDAAVAQDAASADAAGAVDDAGPVAQDAGGAGLDAAPDADAGIVTLDACPTTGMGAIHAPGPCFVLTPQDAGSSSAGDNATVDHYALEPAGTARGVLVVFLNASLASPARQVGDPDTSFYGTLAAAGFHVLALSYRSTAVVGAICRDDAACFGPTRRAIVLGTVEPGAATSLADMREDEGVVFRLDGALAVLARARPSAGWDAFSNAAGADPATRIVWSSVIATGHSQGGGHAAMLGQLFGLRRVVQLSSTCDAVGATPAPWTAASETWATPPGTSFVGFAAETTFAADGTAITGDLICPSHRAVWDNMGMDPSRQHDDALVCPTGGAHNASIGCTLNASRWAALFE